MNPIRMAFLCGLLLFVIFQCDFCASQSEQPVICISAGPTPELWDGYEWVQCNPQGNGILYWNGSSWVQAGASSLATWEQECARVTSLPVCVSQATPAPFIVPNSPVPSGPVAPKLGPICAPPVPSISNISSFCANQSAGLGGVTWDSNPAPGAESAAMGFIFSQTTNLVCPFNQTKTTCSGSPGTNLTYDFCTWCGAPSSQVSAAYTCPSGYVMTSSVKGTDCAPIDVSNSNYDLCPPGTHYDNSLQNCVDNATGDLASPCPAGYPYYLPGPHECLANAYPIVYNCQTFTIPLGECLVPKKPKASGQGQCPAGKIYKCGPYGLNCGCQ